MWGGGKTWLPNQLITGPLHLTRIFKISPVYFILSHLSDFAQTVTFYPEYFFPLHDQILHLFQDQASIKKASVTKQI